MSGPILVTGAAGFIGSHTVDLLLAGGHTVVGVDNFATGRRENLASAMGAPRFAFRELDAADPGALTELAREISPAALIHLAALVSVRQSIEDPGLNFRLNVEMSHRAAEAVRLARISRLVFASSAAAYQLVSPYGAAKRASESLLLGHAAAFGFTVRCQRYFNVYGPRQDPGSPYSGVISIFADRLASHRPLTIFGDGEQTRDFIFVSDVARANVIAATAPGLPSGTADICTGQSTSLNTLVSHLSQGTAPSPKIEYLPARAGDIRHSRGDPLPASGELSFRAEVPLASGLARLKP